MFQPGALVLKLTANQSMVALKDQVQMHVALCLFFINYLFSLNGFKLAKEGQSSFLVVISFSLPTSTPAVKFLLLQVEAVEAPPLNLFTLEIL